MSIHSGDRMRESRLIISSSCCSLGSLPAVSGSGCSPTFQMACCAGTSFLRIRASLTCLTLDDANHRSKTPNSLYRPVAIRTLDLNNPGQMRRRCIVASSEYWCFDRHARYDFSAHLRTQNVPRCSRCQFRAEIKGSRSRCASSLQ